MDQLTYERNYFGKMTDMELDVYIDIYDGPGGRKRYGRPVEDAIKEYWNEYLNERP
tara:strand:+ start:336 stop:503 length:168 start_codon:yes stop_codon:yes gene_type:complete